MFKNYLRPFLFVIGAILISVLSVLVFFVEPTNTLKLKDDKVVEIYFADNISPAHKDLIEKFNEKFKDSIRVVPIDLPFTKFSTNERKELLARALRSKSDKIDVFSVDLPWVPRFARWSEPLDNLVSVDEKEDLLSCALASCYYDSALYALPLYLDIGLMYYRKDIIQRLPNSKQIEDKLKNSITWDEMIDLSKKLNYIDKPLYIYQADAYEGLICNYLELMAGLNRRLFEKGNLQVNSLESQKVVQHMLDLVYKYKISPKIVKDVREANSFKYMMDNDAVFIRGWPGMIKEYRFLWGDIEKLKLLEKAAIPHFAGYNSTSIYGGWNMMISKYSNHKPQALTFIKYFLTEESQKTLYDISGYLPITRKVYEDSSYISKNPDLKYLYTLLLRGFHRPSLVEYTKISDVISYFINKAIKKEISVNEALKEADKMIISNKYLLK